MEPRGIVKAFPKRKKVRDDSGKSIPPKIPKEEGTEIPEGKSCVPVMWVIIFIPSLLTASAVPQSLFLAVFCRGHGQLALVCPAGAPQNLPARAGAMKV